MASPVQGAVGPATGQNSAGGDKAAPTRRGTELVLLGFAAFVVSAALMLVEANQEQQLTFRIVWYGLAFLGLFTIAHVAVRRFAPYADPLILPCVALLNGIGLVFIYRIDLAQAEKDLRAGHEISNDVPRQIMWTAVALLLFLAVLIVIKDHRTLTKYNYTFGFAGLFLLALPAFLPSFIAPTINGAKIWLKVGPLSLQPGEFAKILLLVFFAAFLVSKRDLFMTAGRRLLGVDLPRARDLGPIVFAWAVSLGVLVFQKDLGTSLLFYATILVMLYVATERGVWVVLGVGLFIGGAVIAYHLFTHVQQRVANWFDPLATYGAQGGGYQIAQALFGLGTGGVAGTGLGAGRPDLVPLSNTDFIAAAIGEELGFIGLAALLMVYTVLALRGMRSALAVRDTFGKLLGGGLSFALIMQVFVVVGGVTKLIPMTGITAPFLSYGGSSLLANYVLVALLLRISDAARRPQTGNRPRPAQQAPIAEAHTVMVERPT
ncbi:FtsW/RodA/SpoVE family cell cycle protein [Actinokineospora auranticolor]|uniref:Cell division protein FtsW (Lipid II flippase) n=1 Tax=Actinokineospora auranticolor TaxID=155976 RepID=A0A2S6GSG4_9PSEU|nr:FtsW/RodA/SpoVE family cell cycle protein [Actinokineospora auranticolor]PPK68126.1 cell division protein FtsW (lipid II flippase) [Actinokineospora auranticolor]